MDLSFIIISFNDARRLPRCLSSAMEISARAGLAAEALVVDNGSQDHTPQLLDEYASLLGRRLVVMRLPRNRGTTVSRNLALRRARGRYICVMDSDAELLDVGLAKVLSLLQEFPQVGIVGPRILLPDGSTYDSAKMLPTLPDKLAKLPNIIYHSGPRNLDWYPGFPFDRIRPVDTVISCCWFFRRNLLERVGLLDEHIFYAPEDVDYCLRAWKAGLAVVYYPHYRVLHHTQQVSHARPFSRLAFSHLCGLFYYFAKHRYLFSRKSIFNRYIKKLSLSLQPGLADWDATNCAG